jgi:hypothetical protein
MIELTTIWVSRIIWQNSRLCKNSRILNSRTKWTNDCKMSLNNEIKIINNNVIKMKYRETRNIN